MAHRLRRGRDHRPDEDRVERDQQQIAQHHEPDDPLEGKEFAVVEEPEPAEEQRTAEERGGDNAGYAGDERHDRDQPDEVLRREEPGEGEKGGQRRRRTDDKSLAVRTAAREQDGSRSDRQPIRESAGEVPGQGGGRAGDDLGLVQAETVSRQQNGSAQTLDLERTTALCLDAVDETVPAEDGERPDQHDRSGDERQERGCERSPAAPEPEDEQRQQRRSVELGREGHADQSEGDRVPAEQERSYGSDDEQCRKGVIRVQGDGAEYERRQGNRPERAVQADAARPEPYEHEGAGEKRRHTEQRHEDLERVQVPAVRQERRGSEDEEAARRVLDEEVPVGDAPVQERLAVVAVQADVPKAPPAEEPARGNRGRQEVDGRGERDGPHCAAQLGIATCRRLAVDASAVSRRLRPRLEEAAAEEEAAPAGARAGAPAAAQARARSSNRRRRRRSTRWRTAHARTGPKSAPSEARGTRPAPC